MLSRPAHQAMTQLNQCSRLASAGLLFGQICRRAGLQSWPSYLLVVAQPTPRLLVVLVAASVLRHQRISVPFKAASWVSKAFLADSTLAGAAASSSFCSQPVF